MDTNNHRRVRHSANLMALSIMLAIGGLCGLIYAAGVAIKDQRVEIARGIEEAK